MSDRPTYPELLKLFYKHSFPDRLGAASSSLAQAIIYKANELYFPTEFIMSNVELAHLSGVDVSNVGRRRQRVCETCVVDGIPLFSYVGNDKRKAGTYIINYSLPSRWRHAGVTVTLGSRQIDPLIDNDPNSILPNVTKTTTDAVVSPSADKPKLSETDSLIKLMMDKFKLPTPPSNGDVNQMIYKYGLSCCVDALENSEPKSKTWRGILAYIDKVAKNISAKSHGVTGEKLDQWERELEDLEYEVQELRDAGTYDDPRNKQWLIHTEPKIENLRVLITQYGGKV